MPAGPHAVLSFGFGAQQRLVSEFPGFQGCHANTRGDPVSVESTLCGQRLDEGAYRPGGQYRSLSRCRGQED